MEFAILNRINAQIYKCDVPHLYISMTDPEHSFAELNDNESRIDTLRIKFDDIDCNCDSIDGKRLPKYFDESKADQILKFVEENKDNNPELIICQCDAGISRSSATAAALSVLFNGNGSDKWIFDYRNPNMLVYNTLLNHFMNKNLL